MTAVHREALDGAAELVRVVCEGANKAASVEDLERLDDRARRRFQALDRMGVPLDTISETILPAVDALESRASALGLSWISTLYRPKRRGANRARLSVF